LTEKAIHLLGLKVALDVPIETIYLARISIWKRILAKLLEVWTVLWWYSKMRHLQICWESLSAGNVCINQVTQEGIEHHLILSSLDFACIIDVGVEV
jgi:hypothetical protein